MFFKHYFCITENLISLFSIFSLPEPTSDLEKLSTAMSGSSADSSTGSSKSASTDNGSSDMDIEYEFDDDDDDDDGSLRC